MARRKRQLLEDDDSDSSPGEDNDFDDGSFANDPDARAERELFENPYKHKRRRKNGKEDAIYGVFGSDDEEEDYGRGRGAKGKRSDWTKAPAFTAGEKVDLDKTVDVDEAMKDAEGTSDSDSDEDEQEDEDDEDEDEPMSGPSKEQSPNVREEEEEEEERPRFGGLGLGASKAGLGASKGGIGSGSRGGIGSGSKGGIGSGSQSGAPPAFSGFSKGAIGSFKLSSVTETPPPASPSPAPEAAIPDNVDVPTAFGKQSRPQRAFVRDGSVGAGTSTPKPVPLSATERSHFSKISGTFGARMLEKMGWQAGTGLGAAGEGIVTPVESKLRPKGMGLAFKGFKEKTEQAKAEARRRGEVVSDDEEEARPKKGRKPKGQQQERSDAWKKPKKTKKKIEHKTYEQIVAEAGQDAPANIGQIIDATGATVSLGALHSIGTVLTLLSIASGGIVSR